MSKDINLDELRSSINDIDKGLVILFEKRMDTVKKVAEYKIENNLPVLDAKREKLVIDRAVSHLKDNELTDSVTRFFNDILSVSRQMQHGILKRHSRNKKVAYQGVPGSFGHQAMEEYFGKNVDSTALNSFDDVFTAVKNETTEYGVLPIENSSTGGINKVVDLLRQYGLFIVGEWIVKVEHNLMALPGADLNSVKEVYSHPQGFEQCDNFFTANPSYKTIPYINTAVSAKYVSECGDKSFAAVASKNAARLYGLDILKETINDNPYNYTRFIIIGRQIEEDQENDTISIVANVPNIHGALYHILRFFNQNETNMIKIESRPIPDRAWEYFFFIDFEGNIQNDNIQEVIRLLKKNCSYFNLLGNYKAHRII